MMMYAKISGRNHIAVAAAFLFLVGTLGIAKAQESAGSGMMHHDGGMNMGSESGGMGHGGMMGHSMEHGAGMMGHMMMCHMSEHVEGRLAYAKAELKITDAQLRQWNAFADAFRGSAQKMGQYCAAMGDHGDHEAPVGVIEHLGKMEQHMTTHLDAVRAVKAAAEPLFKTLTDEQKKTANELLMGLMGMGGHIGGHKGGEMGGHMDGHH